MKQRENRKCIRGSWCRNVRQQHLIHSIYMIYNIPKLYVSFQVSAICKQHKVSLITQKWQHLKSDYDDGIYLFVLPNCYSEAYWIMNSLEDFYNIYNFTQPITGLTHHLLTHSHLGAACPVNLICNMRHPAIIICIIIIYFIRMWLNWTTQDISQNQHLVLPIQFHTGWGKRDCN